MIWTKDRILAELRQLNRDGADLSYTAVAKDRRTLLSAAVYHFGSFRKAVVRAGVDYDNFIRRPRWTKGAVIRLIKDARRRDVSLNWASVTERRDELSRAASAAVRCGLFPSWDRALHAAGLDADTISRYRRWSRSTVLFELKERRAGSEALNSGAVQRDDPALHAAVVRYFGCYDSALRAARIAPSSVRVRQRAAAR